MEFQVKIHKYSKRGHGIAALSEKGDAPVEVVSAVVGDEVLVSLGKKKKKCFSGTLLNILNPSEDRVEPRCKHVGTCGGCTWQQKSYLAQLKVKSEQIASLFPIDPLPLIPCANPWQYRNKMEYTFSQSMPKQFQNLEFCQSQRSRFDPIEAAPIQMDRSDAKGCKDGDASAGKNQGLKLFGHKEGEKFLGLMIARSKGRVLNLEECHLTSSWFTSVLGAVRTWWQNSPLLAYHAYTDRGTLRTLTLREGKRSGDKMAFLTISGNHEYCIHKNELEGFKEAVQGALPGEDPSLFLRIQRIAKGKPTEFYEMHLGGPDQIGETLHVKERKLDFWISPDSFFQPNPTQAEILYTRALEIADPQPNDTVFDLYCGTGTLSIVFAPYVKKVLGIELSPYAVCDAEVNIEANQLKNITIHKGDVGKRLQEVTTSPDLAIVDPPRSGLGPTAIKHLLRLAPKKILYISCNPKTQSENITLLIEGGYQLKTLQGVDQFPHTVHVETIALLEKR